MRFQPLSNTARERSEKPLTSGRMSNALPSAEQYGAQTVVKAVTRERMRNLLPSAQQYGAGTVGKAVDERRYDQSAAIS